jgi:hypothetical protein
MIPIIFASFLQPSTIDAQSQNFIQGIESLVTRYILFGGEKSYFSANLRAELRCAATISIGNLLQHQQSLVEKEIQNVYFEK